jgi:hypothetical protein
LGAEKSDVIKVFGNPIKVTKDVQEVIGESWQNYHYKKSILVINPKTNHLRGFDTLDSSFVLTCNSIVVKVGGAMNVFGRGFPRSLKTYKSQKEKYLRLKFKEGDGYILFTIKNDRIIQFQTWDDFY